tara:strand:+ start:1063 stop:1470 length:408 start_codon:yes stop_codon:yes gene_type:complete
MKKLLFIGLMISISMLNANFDWTQSYIEKRLDSISYAEKKLSIIKEKALNAIQNEDYAFIEKIIKDGILNPRASIAGKPLIIHAAINDKAEMVLLLASYGAMIKDPVCDEGKNIMEYAIENKAIRAQAQIILIRA